MIFFTCTIILELILSALYWNQQSCFSVLNACIYNKSMLCEMRAFTANTHVCCANWIVLTVEGIYPSLCCMTVFWKQNLNEMWVKIILISSSCWWYFVTATSAIVHSSTCSLLCSAPKVHKSDSCHAAREAIFGLPTTSQVIPAAIFGLPTSQVTAAACS